MCELKKLLFFLFILPLGVWARVFIPPLENACRNLSGDFDRVCDPYEVVSSGSLSAIQSALYRISHEIPHKCGITEESGYQVVFFVVHSTGDEPVSDLAIRAHNKWGVGHAACNDGAVLVLAVEDRAFYLSTGAGTREILSDQAAEVMQDRMIEDLRNGDPGKALIGIAGDILSVLQAGEIQKQMGTTARFPYHDAERAKVIAAKASALLRKENTLVLFKSLFIFALVAFFGYQIYKDFKKRQVEDDIAARLRAVQRARAEAEAAPDTDTTPLAAR